MRENILKRDQSAANKVSGRRGEVLQAGDTPATAPCSELTFLFLATCKGVKDHSEGLSELPGHSQAGGILGGERQVWSHLLEGQDTRAELELHQDCKDPTGTHMRPEKQDNSCVNPPQGSWKNQPVTLQCHKAALGLLLGVLEGALSLVLTLQTGRMCTACEW